MFLTHPQTGAFGIGGFCEMHVPGGEYRSSCVKIVDFDAARTGWADLRVSANRHQMFNDLVNAF